MNICENRRIWRSVEEMGRAIWVNWSSKNWNQIPNPIENRFVILLSMEKMKNWLQFYQNIPFWWIGEREKTKHLFILPLKEINFQLVYYFFIWELNWFGFTNLQFSLNRLRRILRLLLNHGIFDQSFKISRNLMPLIISQKYLNI